MRELLEAFGFVKAKAAPKFVRAFDAATERVNTNLEERDAFSNLVESMAGRPGRKKSGSERRCIKSPTGKQAS